MNTKKILNCLLVNKWAFIALCLTSFWYAFIAFSNGVTVAAPTPVGTPINDEIYPELQNVFPHYGYYNLLAESLSKGRTWLDINPNPNLLELANPYDATQNKSFRVQDLSLYKGKYYLYFGIVPCAILFFPAFMLGVPISQATGVFIFSLCILWVLGLWLIKQKCSQITKVLGIIFIATSTCLPILLRRPAIYEVSIAAGAVFSILCVIALYSAISKKSATYLGMAGIALALAIGSRPTLIILAPLLIVGGFIIIHSSKRLVPTIISSVPAIVLGLGLAIYNWERFEDPFEFGMSYQLSTNTIAKEAGFKIQNIAPIVNNYLWSQPQFTGDFPYVQPSYLNTRLPDPFYIREPVIGLLYLVPILFLSLIPILNRNGLGILAFSSATLILGFTAFSFPAIHFRYIVDFAPLFTLAGLCGLIQLKRPAYCICLIPSAILIFLYSFSGTHNLLMRAHPEIFVLLDKYSLSIINYPKPKILNISNQNGWNQLGEKPFFIRIYSPKKELLKIIPSKGNRIRNSEFQLQPGIKWLEIYGSGNLNKAILETTDWKEVID